MSTFWVACSVWLHSLATVVFIGHFVLLSLVYLPALQDGSPHVYGAALSAISKRSRNWLYAALIVFAVTGVYLTFVDSNYKGIGNFSNPWAIAMLVKHILVVAMIAIGFWFNAVLRVGPVMSSNTGAAQAVARFRWYANVMALIGVVVLLLTAFSQAQ